MIVSDNSQVNNLELANLIINNNNEIIAKKEERIRELESLISNMIVNLESGNFSIINNETGHAGNMDYAKEILYK